VFAAACSQVRESVYGLTAISSVGPNQVNYCTGTAFMIAPGVLATAGHAVHIDNDPSKPVHSIFEVIRSPDIGMPPEPATLIGVDAVRDIALLRLAAPRSSTCVATLPGLAARGASCGALGFPLASIAFGPTGRMFNLTERFQGANISAYYSAPLPGGAPQNFYETDALMYGGSSGCPGFLLDGRVFGIHVASVIQLTTAAPNASATPPPSPASNRLAISIWVPIADIDLFARASGVI